MEGSDEVGKHPKAGIETRFGVEEEIVRSKGISAILIGRYVRFGVHEEVAVLTGQTNACWG